MAGYGRLTTLMASILHFYLVYLVVSYDPSSMIPDRNIRALSILIDNEF